MLTEMFDGVPDEILCPTCQLEMIKRGGTCGCGEVFAVICDGCGKIVETVSDLYTVDHL
jgi:hypothetical protein